VVSQSRSGGAVTILNNAAGMEFRTGGTPGSSSGTIRMYLNSAGNLGIGESSPDKPLHIKGTNTAGIVIENTTNATNMDIDWYNNVGSVAGRIRYSEGTGDFTFMPNQSTAAVMFKYGGQVLIGSATYTGGKLMVSNSDNTVYDASQASHQRDNGSTLMINNESTTAGSFSQILLRNRSSDVGGCRIVSIDSGANDSELAIVTGDTGESMRILGDGKVGIGTNAPAYLLDLYKSSGTNQDVFAVRGATSAFLVQCSDLSAANPVWNLRTFSGEDLALKPGNSEAVRIKATQDRDWETS